MDYTKATIMTKELHDVTRVWERYFMNKGWKIVKPVRYRWVWNRWGFYFTLTITK